MLAELPSARLGWKPGRTWQAGDSLPEMVDLPLGVYEMGGGKDDKFTSDLERPRHRVALATPIALGRFPVTVSQYAAFRGEAFAPEESRWPVAGVSWDDAIAYCAWLAAETGDVYRLPSEAEWEYAGAAGQSGAFPSGSVLTPRDANYLYDEHGNRVGPGRRTPVGSYPQNAFGLYDMIGNVCEWVGDTWHPSFRGAPEEGESWSTADGNEMRVLRGGAWDYMPRLLRIRWRDFLPRNVRRDNVGFRVACSLHP